MKHVFLTCGLLIALTSGSYCAAQNIDEQEALTRDTLVVHLDNEVQVRVIAGSMKDVYNYNRVDSLRTLFLADLRSAIAQSESKTLPKAAYYLVHASGQRRLKMKADEYADEAFDLAKETYRLDEKLGKHELNIYDLKYDVHIQFYINEEKDLSVIESSNLQPAIAYTKTQKKEAKRYYRYDVKPQLDGFTKINKERNHLDAIMLNFYASANLIGSVWVPAIGARIGITNNDKYGKTIFKTGISVTSLVFADFSAGKFNKVYMNDAYDAFFLFNANNSNKQPYLFGLKAGIITNSSADAVFRGNHFQWGLLMEHRSFEYSVGFISGGKDMVIPMLGIALPF